ncbi:MAG: DedA family protein [Proteobacteria bacterium]|nr:DedA family protein [Pseudomonadota bacterium]
MLPPEAAHAVGHYGYGAVALAVGIESFGIPFPGETVLLAAAVYAGSTHHLNIVLVVAAAAFGAIMGDNLGFWLGRTFGLRLLLRFGGYIRITPRRIKLGQYMFMRYGGAVVFFGRFVAVLRALAAFLAGANQMSWPRFLIYNGAGAIVWASLYGFGIFYFGEHIHRLLGPVGIGLGIVAVLVIGGWIVFLKRHETRLEDEAEKVLPGPIRARRSAAR